MARKIGLLTIALLGLATAGGCETMYGKSSCPGGCCGGSCGAGASSPVTSGYIPSSPPPTYGGGSGTK